MGETRFRKVMGSSRTAAHAIFYALPVVRIRDSSRYVIENAPRILGKIRQGCSKWLSNERFPLRGRFRRGAAGDRHGGRIARRRYAIPRGKIARRDFQADLGEFVMFLAKFDVVKVSRVKYASIPACARTRTG